MTTLFQLALALSCAVSFAGPLDLLNMKPRPTMADLDREAPKGGENPYSDTRLKRSSVPIILREVAAVIAQLELHFPGSVYMPLGRDVVFMGDVIDAFYRAHGQPGRVIRIDSSRTSLPPENDQTMLMNFMGSLIDIPNILSSRGYVLIDNTSYTVTSQSTLLTRAVYQAFKDSGGNAEDLIGKFNVITLWYDYPSKISFDSIPRTQKGTLAQYGRPHPAYYMTAPYPTVHVTTYTDEWHDSFGPLYKDASGKTSAVIPVANKAPLLEGILFVLWEIRRAVAEPSFLDQVKAQARELKYEFSFERGCENAAL